MARILIVESNQIQSLLLSMYLQGLGHEVRDLANGIVFWEYLELFSPNLILMELVIPGVSGLDLLQEMVKQQICLPVVVVTTQSLSAQMEQALALGAKKYIMKPVDPEVIASAIAEVLRDDAVER